MKIEEVPIKRIPDIDAEFKDPGKFVDVSTFILII